METTRSARTQSRNDLWWSRKKSKFDGKVKSSKFKARKSWGMRRTYSTLQWFTLLNIFFVWYYCLQAAPISHIYWYGCLQFNRAGDAVQRRSWTFYEAIKVEQHMALWARTVVLLDEIVSTNVPYWLIPSMLSWPSHRVRLKLCDHRTQAIWYFLNAPNNGHHVLKLLGMGNEKDLARSGAISIILSKPSWSHHKRLFPFD